MLDVSDGARTLRSARRVRLLDPLLGTADALDGDSFDIVGVDDVLTG